MKGVVPSSVYSAVKGLRTMSAENKANCIKGDCYRITVLDDGLVRLEYDGKGIFEDRPTQTVVNRNFPVPGFEYHDHEEWLEIDTARFHLEYDKKPFSSSGLFIKVKGNFSNYRQEYRFGMKIDDLGGTCRTLDEVNGASPLGHGISSRFGFSLLDDSTTMTLTDDGFVLPRTEGTLDLYFFAYGHDYKKALKAFYFLCGKTPMLPRYALGNWWSRYYRYSQQSYLELMDRFTKQHIPFSVAVLDMDWHLTDNDIDPAYGSGWTGYTWNRKLFPDPEKFLAELHNRGMKVTLNDHPADGIRAFEENYAAAAAAMGINPESKKPVQFDMADLKFIRVRQKYILDPLENQGVDFWWIDWQQGNNTKIPGLDPLWMLNHYTFRNMQSKRIRPLIFSRYAGPGSHRYPVGFSGDTYITWESLDFQPYFTAAASNIGYGWWSHDIGGHMHGKKDDDMACRWIKFGVFSPINRLHSSNCEFSGKEPWHYRKDINEIMTRFLQLRHRMIPYLYTMNYRAYNDDEPLVQPVYYSYPEETGAYQVKNEYLFGTQMIVAPVTSPQIERLNLGNVKVWLPCGMYYDFFKHTRYTGGRFIRMYRSMESIPVLIKAGGIIPLTDTIEPEAVQNNPDTLRFMIYAGADGKFTLYEDDNSTEDYLNGSCVTTAITFDWKNAVLTVSGAEGTAGFIPEKRNYILQITGIQNTVVQVTSGGRTVPAQSTYERGVQTIIVNGVQSGTGIKITWNKRPELYKNNVPEEIYTLLDRAEIDFDLKSAVYSLVCSDVAAATLPSQLVALTDNTDLVNSILEYLEADGTAGC
jgi:alpha-glucosidase (family GH31 glycosyl hydrolase)